MKDIFIQKITLSFSQNDNRNNIKCIGAKTLCCSVWFCRQTIEWIYYILVLYISYYVSTLFVLLFYLYLSFVLVSLTKYTFWYPLYRKSNGHIHISSLCIINQKQIYKWCASLQNYHRIDNKSAMALGCKLTARPKACIMCIFWLIIYLYTKERIFRNYLVFFVVVM